MSPGTASDEACTIPAPNRNIIKVAAIAIAQRGFQRKKLNRVFFCSLLAESAERKRYLAAALNSGLGSREETCFVDCRSFGRNAENINKYCKKGRPLFVEGRLSYDSWTAQDGSKRSKLRVTVENFQFIGSAGQNSGVSGSQTQSQEVSEKKTFSEPATPARTEEDDIPF